MAPGPPNPAPRRRASEDNAPFDPRSMSGLISVKDMGSRVAEAPADGGNAPLTSAKNSSSTAALGPPIPADPLGVPGLAAAYYSDLAVEQISYRPSDPANRASFELLTAEVRGFIPDEPHGVILLAADAILEVLKSDDSSVGDKRRRVETLLSRKLDDMETALLVALAGRITDHGAAAGAEGSANGDGAVAVVFEDDENEDRAAPVLEPESPPSPGPGAGAGGALDADAPPRALPESGVTIAAKPGAAAPPPIALKDVTKDLLFRMLLKAEPGKDRQDVVDTCRAISKAIMSKDAGAAALEASLMDILQYQHLELVKFCVQNRDRIAWATRLRANRAKTIEELRAAGAAELLAELGEAPRKRRLSAASPEDPKRMKTATDSPSAGAAENPRSPAARQPRVVDLEGLVFDQGPQLMAAAKVVLPKGSFQQNKKLYDTISVPAPAGPPSLEDAGEKLVAIGDMPAWARPAFPSAETSTLNRIQSKVYPAAFLSDDNLLLCAPTGAGKTNVAMLAVLRVLHNFRNPDTGKLDLKGFKAVYVAPLKALVSEQTREFQRRLSAEYGIVVNELTGDLSLSQKEIAETQVLVTTPEKWDVVTRKATDALYTKLVRLLIIDEIHLLHDDRGPVLESIIVRAKRLPDTRLVGLSATLPNYEDVAQFLGVNLKLGLFYFDALFRPCPLEQQFIGIKEKKAILKVAAMNEACYEKVVECRKNGHQVIIFVHSRKDTVKTAKWLAEKAADNNVAVSNPSVGTQEILKQEGENAQNRNLAEVLPTGFGIHHAGLNKADRSVVEDLFAQGHIQVLVSTATLAWGVNLPAHTVIIKGTETYNPEKGSWVQLSPQDILQMLGRAGRPRYDVSGEGVIITAQDELQYYLAILNQQLPIESQFMSRLADNLNAEIVLGKVRSRNDAVEWLAQTYLYIRMLKSPKLYQVGAEYENDEALVWKRTDLVHSALVILQQHKLAHYDASTGQVAASELGRVAAHFYIGHETIAVYNANLKPWMSEIDVLQIFSFSGEFKYVPVRQEEKIEVSKLSEKCPIAIKENPSDPHAKINVLLQAYITRLRLEGFALTADMIYITQSAGRLLRAIHEICLKKKWAQLARVTLDLCKFVERRMWNTNSPFRQFGDLAPANVIKATEASHLPFMSYFQLSAAELSEAINFKGSSQLAYDLLRQFPKLSVECQAQPISPTMVRVLVDVYPEWEWNWKIHGSSESFLLLVEDCDGEQILYDEIVKITPKTVNRGFAVDFTVLTPDPLPPAMFVAFSSEKWLHSQWRAPIKMFDMRLPKVPHNSTEVLDVQSVPTSSLKNDSFEKTFSFSYFNKFQSQCFHSLMNTNENVFIGLSKGSGKTACAELAILNTWRQNKQRVVYILPTAELVERQRTVWAKKYARFTEPPKVVAKLTGDLSADARVLAQSHLVLATPEQFDAVSRRWRQRKSVQQLDLLIADDIHMVGSGSQGAVYETVLSRMRFMTAHLGRELRIVGLSHPLTYGREIADWLGCKKPHVYNFDPMARFRPVQEIKILPYTEPQFLEAFVKSCSEAVIGKCPETSLVFVPTRKTAMNIVSVALESKETFLTTDLSEIKSLTDKVLDAQLQQALEKGIGLYYEGMNARDQLIVEKLLENKLVGFVLATKNTSNYAPQADNVIIFGSQSADDHHANDYFLNDILNMVGCCANGNVLAYLYGPKVAYYSHFLSNSLPVESNLNFSCQDVFMQEIAARTFLTKQDCIDWITYTLFYRRLTQNPSFYGLSDVSHIGISEYLSELVETTLEDLEKADLVEIEDNDDENDTDDGTDEEEEERLSPLNGAMIAAHYTVLFQSMKTLGQLTSKARLRNIIEAITSASEFDDVPVRPDEEAVLSKIARQVPLKLASDTDFMSSQVKAFLLVQAHLTRIRLPAELALDQKKLLPRVLKLAHACVDTLSSEGYLNALQAMDLSQMVVQGMWNRESPLRQIPHVNEGMLQRGKKYNVETIYDIMSLEDDERDEVLQLEGRQLQDVAEFVNKYPNIDVLYEFDTSSTVKADEPQTILVTVERDEEPEDLEVVSSRYPEKRTETWWIVVGDFETRQLYAIKKTQAPRESQTIAVEFSIPTPGKHKLTVWCMCDSYIDADKEMAVEIDVVE
ncbi:Sec63-domain-containing protein [Metschnikowia bicuspidata var. bicuspidata NRRL YB-4993]|uniref:U5 small nuclear ribonucleoprotein 200 kDa helicase n=1 Tax=Metschnikowia bicuspidata var. bicuspidata NRRL YB-4993 TaxID=869754 RepID=A0A1A0H9N8_9ASCO|nr:Sec63-domain-containing protein [Metschnikowia bicuspidata var. bicuspidata NRRL YB-4993]OBA20593.1 Sec63-domain-containing protein [Metschnikowia bicuspidata var. bicuspidata NRRL YB-4993]